MAKLINEETNQEIKIGDAVKTFRGNTVTVVGFREPHKPSSTGRVTVRDENGECEEFFPGVISAKIIEHQFS